MLTMMLALAAAMPAVVDDSVSADLRCFIAYTAKLGERDDTPPELLAGVAYFGGRLDGEAPDLDLLARIHENVAADPEGTQSARDFVACSQRISAFGQRLTMLSKALSETE